MRFVFGKKRFVLAAISLAFILAACGGSSHARSGTTAVGTVKDAAPPPKYVSFTGFPPVGARATLPVHSALLVELPVGSLYADGHIMIGSGVQRLTARGAQLLWSKIRAIGLKAGLFSHNLQPGGENHRVSGWYDVCHGPMAPARGRALARIDTLFNNARSQLPARAWANRTIRPFVPSHYVLTHDRMDPDPAKLPSPAREVLAQYKSSHYDQTITTAQARALIAAFVEAGVKLVHGAGLAFSLPIANGAADLAGDHTILELWKVFAQANQCNYRYGGG